MLFQREDDHFSVCIKWRHKYKDWGTPRRLTACRSLLQQIPACHDEGIRKGLRPYMTNSLMPWSVTRKYVWQIIHVCVCVCVCWGRGVSVNPFFVQYWFVTQTYSLLLIHSFIRMTGPKILLIHAALAGFQFLFIEILTFSISWVTFRSCSCN